MSRQKINSVGPTPPLLHWSKGALVRWWTSCFTTCLRFRHLLLQSLGSFGKASLRFVRWATVCTHICQCWLSRVARDSVAPCTPKKAVNSSNLPSYYRGQKFHVKPMTHCLCYLRGAFPGVFWLTSGSTSSGIQWKVSQKKKTTQSHILMVFAPQLFAYMDPNFKLPANKVRPPNISSTDHSAPFVTGKASSWFACITIYGVLC